MKYFDKVNILFFIEFIREENSKKYILYLNYFVDSRHQCRGNYNMVHYFDKYSTLRIRACSQ